MLRGCAVCRRFKSNRSILLRVDDNGRMVFDTLAARDYDGVVALLGEQEPQRVRPPKLERNCVLRERNDRRKKSRKLNKIEYTPRVVVCSPRRP